MRRGLRSLLVCVSFALFFSLALVLSVGAGLTAPRRADDGDRRRFTHRLNRGFRLFLGFLEDVGLIAPERVAMPPELAGRPFLLVANHPTLLDAPLLLAALPELVSLVKSSWYATWALGPLLRRTAHVPGPGLDGDAALAPVVDRLEAALRAGLPALAFPEATRSPAGSLRRFRRGAIEAALRAEVPIVPLFIGVDPPILTKEQPAWRVPPRAARYRFEWLAPVPDAVRARGSREVTSHVQAALAERVAVHRRLVEEPYVAELAPPMGVELT